jgi:hypothetical protein
MIKRTERQAFGRGMERRSQPDGKRQMDNGLARMTIAMAAAVLTLDAAAEPVWLEAVLVEDTYIESDNPANVYAASAALYLGRDNSGVTRCAFMQWRLPRLPSPNHRAVAATLRTRTMSAESAAQNHLELGHLNFNPNLSTLTWNAAITQDIISGRDSDYTIIWGDAATIWPDRWISPGSTAFQWNAYGEIKPGSGLLPALQASLSASASNTWTMITGPHTGNDKTNRRCYSKNKSSAPPAGPWRPTLSILVERPRGTLLMVQ